MPLAAAVLITAGAPSCSSPESGGSPPSPPPADRESWGAHLLLSGPASSASIKANLLEDFSDRQVSVARDGVEITLSDSAGDVNSRLRALRFTLDHRSRQLAAAGDVVVDSDSITLRSDTLEWEQTRNDLRVPGALTLATPRGRLRGRNLIADPKLRHWSLEDVDATWVRRRETGAEFSVSITAVSARTRRESGETVSDYERPRANSEGRWIRGDHGTWHAHSGQFLLEGSVVVEDSARTLRAERAEIDLDNQRSVASGGVVVDHDTLRLAAESIVDHHSGTWVAAGDPLHLRLGSLQLAAPSLEHNRDGDTYAAVGRSRFVLEEDTLVADSLVLGPSEGRVDAKGDVHLIAPGFNAALSSASALFDLDRGTIDLFGNPKLRSQTDSLLLGADTLSLNLNDSLVTGIGRFYVEARSVGLRSRRGAYDARCDSALFSGGVEIEISGRSTTPSLLRADSARASIGDGLISGLEFPGSFTAAIASGDDHRSWLQAGSGCIDLVDGELRRLLLAGAADVTHQSASSEAVSRFRADEMTLEFASGAGLLRVRAEGAAEVRSRMPGARGFQRSTDSAAAAGPTRRGEGALNEVTGKTLEIVLEDGAVAEVRVLAGIEGRYTPAKDENDRD